MFKYLLSLLGLGEGQPAAPDAWSLGDISLDALFSDTEGTPAQPADPGTPSPAPAPAVQPAAAPTAPTPAAPAPQAPAPGQPATPSEFIKTGTGTVYKTQEEAVKGIEHKDAVIADLRSRYIQQTGIDPLTGQPATRQPVVPQPPQSYTQDNKAYLADLRKALEGNDPDAYYRTQAKLVLDLLEPIAPLVTRSAKTQAMENVEGEVKDIRNFISSPGYQKAMDANSDLAQAIQTAESDYRFHDRLPNLYKLAYAYSVYQNLPSLLESAKSAGNQAPPARPSTTPGTLAPPASPSAQPNLATHEGWKAIIEAAEGRGLDQILFKGGF